MLSQGEFLQLLAAVSSPSENNPAQESNVSLALVLSQRLRKENLVFVSAVQVRANLGKSKSSWSLFELERFFSKKQGFCRVSLDESLNERVREIVRKTLQELQSKSVGNAAAIVLKLPENEVLSLVGSPDPFSSVSGRQIDMLLEPRPIGSTIKPFIYLKAFEKGLRPYTLVDDREYKYITALGFPLYPKNYDYQYRGLVSLHYALSNSLNVPAVKTLEYAGLEDFYRFWQGVGFNPLRPWAEYQLGVALGGLEMSLFDLASSFTLCPNNGRLKPVKIFQAGDCLEPELTGREITEPGYIQLVNRVLNDRQTGMDQFGRKSELNLFQNNYALKTGTSRDFRDSWVVGYTPDFLVGVWAGNADNSPTDQVSGQEGAGLIFSQIMELLFNSAYNKKTAFDFSLLKDYQAGQTLDWGLPGDDYEKVRNLLLASDTSLILLPHDNDTFVLEVNTKIILRAKETVSWFVDNEFLTQGKEAIFAPDRSGAYQILARSSDQSEAVTIVVDN
jgi:membrane carboxypeptidase/penicillin-binding protein PbpC